MAVGNVSGSLKHIFLLRLTQCAPPTVVLFIFQVEAAGEPVDVMHYHHAWDGFYDGGWGDAKAAYRKIMREPSDVKLVTVMREPVGHYLSYYYYFLQPETGVR